MLCSLCQTPNPADAQRCRACGAPLGGASRADNATPDALPAGATLIGTYVVESVLGQGGFGITYRAHDRMLDRRVAVKEFFPAGCRRHDSDVEASRGQSQADYREARDQFLAEARTLARCHHPGIVSVYTAFEANQTAYMVMELLHGQSLAQLITARGGRLPQAEAVGIIERVGAALGFVHGQSLLHRDIKPDNIMVCDDARVMLIDFGTARETIQGNAANHTVVVTPGYAPLEQYAKQAKRGPFTDIYSLAATLYHLLTGQMPPAASDRAMGVQLRPVRELNPQTGASVARAVESGLAMEIARRPQSVDEFLSALKTSVAEAQADGDALGGSRPVARGGNVARDEITNSLDTPRFSDYEAALKARQQLLEGFLPDEEPHLGEAPVVSQPVKIAPQNQKAAPAPPVALNNTSGGVSVANASSHKKSSALGWWILGVIGFFWFVTSFDSGRTKNDPAIVNIPPGYQVEPSSSSSYVAPPRVETEAESKQKAATAAWSALPSLAPASVVELPSTESSNPVKGMGIAFSPDGKQLAYSDVSSVLRVLSLPSRRVVRTFKLERDASGALHQFFARWPHHRGCADQRFSERLARAVDQSGQRVECADRRAVGHLRDR